MRDNEAKEFNLWLLKFAFRQFKIKVVLGKLHKDKEDFLLVISKHFCVFGMDEKVVHIDCEPSLVNKIPENGIGYGLETG